MIDRVALALLLGSPSLESVCQRYWISIDVDGQFPTVFVDQMNIEGAATARPLCDPAEAPRRIFKELGNPGLAIGENDALHDEESFGFGELVTGT